MKRNVCLTIVLPVFLALQGCVVVIGTDSDDGVYLGGRDHDEGGVQHDGDRLSRDVARAIAGDAELVAEDIRVSSESGTVVLRGRVHAVQTLERALTIARGVEGVEDVISKMTVDGSD
ncbi:MAG TPA: BON domain-containing protein [Gammaproteobacteria bacterium]